MRYTLVAAIFAGITVANPLVYRNYGNGYNVHPTGGQPSSSKVVPTQKSSSSSTWGYAGNTPSPSAVPVASSSSTKSWGEGYPHLSSAPTTLSSSSAFTSTKSVPYGTGYSSKLYEASTPVPHSSTWSMVVSSNSHNATISTSSSSKWEYNGSTPSPTPSPFASKGHEYNATTSTVPYGTGYSLRPEQTVTDKTSTYITTTCYDVTQTSGTQVYTTSTTETITITECKACHHPSATVTPIPTPIPSSSQPEDTTTTITQTTYSWVPCSTPVGLSGHSTIYSTYLTASYTTRTITSTIYGCGGKSCATRTPAPPAPSAAPSSIAQVYPVESPAPQPPAYTSQPPIHTPKPQVPAPSVPALSPSNCPADVTVTITRYLSGPGETPTPSDVTKTIIVTELGVPQTHTVTLPGSRPTQPGGYPEGPKPGHSSKPQPSGHSWVPYPTDKPHYTTGKTSTQSSQPSGNSPVWSPSASPTPSPTGWSYSGHY